ncbi:hypothetical protein AZZ87_002592, partial [Escherichia coli]
ANDPDVINAFNLFPPAVVLARDIVVDTLPIRLDELEARISLIADNVEKKNNHIKELELKIDAFSERFDNYFNNEKSNLKIINELQSLINFNSCLLYTSRCV